MAHCRSLPCLPGHKYRRARCNHTSSPGTGYAIQCPSRPRLNIHARVRRGQGLPVYKPMAKSVVQRENGIKRLVRWGYVRRCSCIRRIGDFHPLEVCANSGWTMGKSCETSEDHYVEQQELLAPQICSST